MNTPILIKGKYVVAIIVLIVILAIIIWGLTLHIYGGHREDVGYMLGRQAERARNPAAQYVESGRAFCADTHGNFYYTQKNGLVFKIAK